MNQPIYGHGELRKRLLGLVTRDLLPHALLFVGQQGIGKARIAQELAETILLKQSSDTESDTHLLSKNAHPDLSVIDCADSEQAKPDSLRDLLRVIHKSPIRSSLRVTILLEADALSPAAANLILKTLEEPRPAHILMLTATTKTRLLRTIVSRCQVYSCPPLPTEIVKKIVHSLYGKIINDELLLLLGGSIPTLEQYELLEKHAKELSPLIEEALEGSEKARTSLLLRVMKDKDQAIAQLRFVRSYAQRQITSPQVAKFIWNLLVAEELIEHRNLQAQYLVNMTFHSLSEPIYAPTVDEIVLERYPIA